MTGHRLWVAVFMLFWFGSAQAGDLSVISEEYPPFNFTYGGKATGAAVEIVQEITRRLAVDADIQFLPWARGYKIALTRPNVALFTTGRNAERESLFHWVGPLYIVRNGFYGLKTSAIRLKTINDARTVRAIATYKDDVREQELAALGFDNLDSANSLDSNMRKLLSGRVDLMVIDNLTVARLATQMGFDPETVELVMPFHEHVNYIAMSIGTPETVVRRWQATLDGMKQDGTYQRISRRWLPDDSLPDSDRKPAQSNEPAIRLKLFTEDSPPGNYLENGQPTGFSVDVVREILRRMRRDAPIQTVPWARGYHMARSEPNVALFSTTRLPQREALFHWVGPLYTQNWGFYAKRGAGLRIRSMADAKAVARIGTYRRDAKRQYLEALGFQNLINANKNISNIKHLLRGDIDLWVSSDFNMPYLAKQAGVDPRRLELVFAFRKVDNYIAFSLDTDRTLLREWEATLSAVRADGTFTRICHNYGISPPPPGTE